MFWQSWKVSLQILEYKVFIESSYSKVKIFGSFGLLQHPFAHLWRSLHQIFYWVQLFQDQNICQFCALEMFFLQILEGPCARYSRQPLFPIRRKPLGNIVSILYGTMLFSYLDFFSLYLHQHHHLTFDICWCTS